MADLSTFSKEVLDFSLAVGFKGKKSLIEKRFLIFICSLRLECSLLLLAKMKIQDKESLKQKNIKLFITRWTWFVKSDTAIYNLGFTIYPRPFKRLIWQIFLKES